MYLAITTKRYGVSVNIYGDNLMGGQGSGPYWLKDVTCNGDEENLLACPDLNWGPHSDYDRVAAVICSNTAFDGNRAPLRLSGGNSASSGVLEIFYAGHWGNIGYTTSYFVQEDLDVACRQLNYSNGFAVADYYGSGDELMVIWGRDVDCNGTEQYLEDCAGDWTLNTKGYQHLYDVGVICSLEELNTTMEGELRIVDGTPTIGRLEIYIHGIWGGICVKKWKYSAASVACRQMGFTSGRALFNNFFGQDDGPVWMSDVQCVGNESMLVECPFGGWGVQELFPIAALSRDLRHGIGIICSDLEHYSEADDMYGDIRLASGSSEKSGRIEVYGPTGYGTIRKDAISSESYEVICNQLGWSTPQIDDSFGPGTGMVWLFVVNCNGDEERFEYCKSSGWGLYARTNHAKDTEEDGETTTLPPEEIRNIMLELTITSDIVMKILNNQGPKKSPGLDNVPSGFFENVLLRSCSSSCYKIQPITKKGSAHEYWKRAQVCAIHKKGDKYVSGNYLDLAV
ncbi:neurotrypsin-like [Pecten maximus]|uniref:neurotrypsin-like n=1 Tax=Pecten maximus TaxID=6579 RepID=UPI001458DAF4|nr:neurotrypsin-like [Pecten maximus]